MKGINHKGLGKELGGRTRHYQRSALVGGWTFCLLVLIGVCQTRRSLTIPPRRRLDGRRNGKKCLKAAKSLM